MAKIEWVHHRLERWADWVAHGRRAGGARTHPMWRDMPVDGMAQREALIPVNEEECWRTEEAIKALPAPLAETCAMYYLQDSGRTRQKLCISSATLSQRIDQAHHKLSEAWLTERVGPVAEQLPKAWGSFPPLTKQVHS